MIMLWSSSEVCRQMKGSFGVGLDNTPFFTCAFASHQASWILQQYWTSALLLPWSDRAPQLLVAPPSLKESCLVDVVLEA